MATKPVDIPPKTRHKRWQWVACGLLAITVIVIAGLVYYLRTTGMAPAQTAQQSDEKYYFADSRYKGIRSKFVVRRTDRQTTSLEYPITENATINKTVANAIDDIDSEFNKAVAAGSTLPGIMAEHTSYQVTHNSSAALSILVHATQHTHGAHPMHTTRFWTFNKQTGATISLDDLTNRSPQSSQAIVEAARHSARQALSHEKKEAPEDLDSYLTKDTLANFIFKDENTLVWEFSAATVLPASYGSLTIKLPLASIAKHLQNPFAKRLITVPDPPAEEPPKPKPAPAPTPPPAAQAPSGNCGQAKCIALTFDDGPGIYTAGLLDTLERAGAKGTFFVIGSKVNTQPGVLRRMQANGHQIGSHSWSHPLLTQLGPEGVQAEIRSTSDAIAKVTGQRPILMRPPYGGFNQPVLDELRAQGMASILWSVDTRDWADRNSSIVCSRAVAGAAPGAIILMHDIHPTSVDAVPCILDSLKQQGYQFVTVSTLLGKTEPGVKYP